MTIPGRTANRSAWFVVACVAVVLLGGVALASVGGVEAQPTDGINSWPMEGHDPGQTAASPDAAGPAGNVGPGWISVTGYGPGVTVVDDRVFVAGGDRQGEVVAYDPDEGTRVWRTQLGDAISSKPMVDGETVYVHVVAYDGRDIMEDHHEVVALDAESGEVKWRFEATDDRYEYTTFRWKTLTVADGELYIAGENSDEWASAESGFILSIDEDGEERWRSDTAASQISRAAIEDDTIVTSVNGPEQEQELLALHTADGGEQWRTTHPNGHALSPPAIDNGSVYVNAQTPLELDLRSGEVTTEYDVAGTAARPIAVTEEQLFVPGGTTRQWVPTQLYAVDRQTGESEWSYGTPHGISSRPVAASETVFVGGQDGVMYALDSENGDERWVYEVNSNYNINNEPAVVGETLYIGPVDNRVYALVDGGAASEPVVVAFLSRFLPVLGDFVGFLAVVALVYLSVGIPFGVLGGIALFGIVLGLRLSRFPMRSLAAAIFRTPLSEVTPRREFVGMLVGSIVAVLAIGGVSAFTFGWFPINGLLTAIFVVGGAWLFLAYQLLPAHAEILDSDSTTIKRQWAVLLAVYGLIVGLLYPLVVFVILMGIYFS